VICKLKVPTPSFHLHRWGRALSEAHEMLKCPLTGSPNLLSAGLLNRIAKRSPPPRQVCHHGAVRKEERPKQHTTSNKGRVIKNPGFASSKTQHNYAASNAHQRCPPRPTTRCWAASSTQMTHPERNGTDSRKRPLSRSSVCPPPSAGLEALPACAKSLLLQLLEPSELGTLAQTSTALETTATCETLWKQRCLLRRPGLANPGSYRAFFIILPRQDVTILVSISANSKP
jgi:hypothetical protein